MEARTKVLYIDIYGWAQFKVEKRHQISNTGIICFKVNQQSKLTADIGKMTFFLHNKADVAWIICKYLCVCILVCSLFTLAANW